MKVKFEISESLTGEKLMIAEADNQRFCLADGTLAQMQEKMLSAQEKLGDAVTQPINPDFESVQKRLEGIPNAHAKVAFEADLDVKTGWDILKVLKS